ncbi:MAG: hypothetical protein Q8N83_04760 [Ignavibacteria bacterium]|nr:hypothetical protein [Ignavibacteria bacterium]
MDITVIFLTLLVLIPVIYFFYFWANSETLSDNEVGQLGLARRFWDIHNDLGFSNNQLLIDKEFKSKLNIGGQFYSIDEKVSVFPSFASALLKNKKHEWVIFAFVKDKKVFSFYTNKGNDNQSVTPSLTLGMINSFVQNGKVDTILEFHNHTNVVLSPSDQDINSSNSLGESLIGQGINFMAFVCGAGNYYQYGWWFTKNYFNFSEYIGGIQKENGLTRSINFELRKELKRKKYFMDVRLGTRISHNIKINKDNSAHSVDSQKNNLDETVYRNKILGLFQENLLEYPKSNYGKSEDIQNEEETKNEIWKKYSYTLTQKELGIFSSLEIIDRPKGPKSFTFFSDEFNPSIVKSSVNTLYEILGNDESNRGPYSATDDCEISERNFWLGRTWMDTKNKNGWDIMLSQDNDENRLELFIKWW